MTDLETHGERDFPDFSDKGTLLEHAESVLCGALERAFVLDTVEVALNTEDLALTPDAHYETLMDVYEAQANPNCPLRNEDTERTREDFASSCGNCALGEVIHKPQPLYGWYTN